MNSGSNEGDPGPRPHYSSDGHYAYGRDLDGNKLLFYFDGGVKLGGVGNC